MTKKITIRLVIGLIAVILIAFLAQTVYRYYCRIQKSNNHEAIMSFVDDELTYEPESLDEQMAKIDEWLAKSNVNDEDKGRLYERKSLAFKMQGKTADYFHAIGQAIYYLNKSGNLDYTTNVYLDLANFYVINESYQRANIVINELLEEVDIDAIDNLQVQCYAYRMLAVLAIQGDDYDAALNYLDQAQAYLDQSNTGIFEEAYQAMIDVNRARAMYGKGDGEYVRQFLADYADSPLFLQTEYAEVLVREFVIPYRELLAYVTIEDTNGDFETCKMVIDQLVANCEEYGYKRKEIKILEYLIQNLPPTEENGANGINQVIYNAYAELADIQTEEYTALIEGQIYDSRSQLEVEDAQIERTNAIRQYVVMYLIFVIALVVVIFAVVYSSMFDGLTHIYNRKAFNSALAKAKKSNKAYGIIMMDIDDFKHVNDTYGHPAGDRVLSALAAILATTQNGTCKAYRYGGEEFVMLLDERSAPSIKPIAENLRIAFAALEWGFGEHITMSVGVAVGYGLEEDVLAKADEKLYYAKQHGKNQVVM